MGTATVRRRHSALAAGLATLALAVGFTAAPATAAPPRDLEYVALGDSYTAGTGADTVGRTAMNPFEQTFPCHQTPGGYVEIVDRSPLINLVDNDACHGALLTQTTWDGVTSVKDQLDALVKSEALSGDTELVSLTAGANDLGFANIIGICATKSPADCDVAVRSATSRENLGVLSLALADTYMAIETAAPDATIVVFGYPLLFDTTNPAVPLPIPLTSQELINQGTLAINGVIESAVDFANDNYDTNAVYVDVTKRFGGHEVNSVDPWIFFGFLDASGVPQLDPRSFHPTADGHRAYASALLASVKLGQLARP